MHCHYCKANDHLIKQCPKLKAKDAKKKEGGSTANAGSTTNAAIIESFVKGYCDANVDVEWAFSAEGTYNPAVHDACMLVAADSHVLYFDSGATKHITSHHDLFTSLERICIPLLLLLAAAAIDGGRTAIDGKLAATTAVLSDLYLSAGTLVPAFDPAIFYYTVSLNSSYTEVAVYVEVPPDQDSAGSGVSVNGSWVDSGSYSPLLELGEAGYTTTVYVYVLAIGYKPATYTVYVTRESDSDDDSDSDSDSSSSSSGLSVWYIVLIVIVCLLVLALLAYALYWAFRRGYLDCIPGVAARRSPGDYQSIS
ncbi:hypothetical protein L7F22_005651 [Adiantum nelumboides]|nr:hypothetical protein [Adiantum nelumboides]